ncbi:brachyurin-like [Leptidea sinapis]|uniref:brachyurin-like n=1 Tax=Leptidea sinapis TaxID=189913 RepID=UPI00212B2568|nr:brachyurin-like [Leptidea sinapis]
MRRIMLVYLYILVLLVISASSVCNNEHCSKIESRVIGGAQSERNSRPYQVALYMRVGTTGQLGFCGGALVDQQWVLTAAHCCFHDGNLVDNIQVILGAHSLYDRYEHGRRIVHASEVHIHPDFQPDNFTNDLALLKLTNTIQLTDTIMTVRLPYLSISTFNFAGAAGTLSGWGIAGPTVTFVSPTLRSKTMTVITDQLCNSTFFSELPPNTVCALAQFSGTCKGDNGGPLTIFYNDTEEDILIGVASFVHESGCNDSMPSVFTRVSRFLQWISEVTGIVLQ